MRQINCSEEKGGCRQGGRRGGAWRFRHARRGAFVGVGACMHWGRVGGGWVGEEREAKTQQERGRGR